MPEEEKSKSKEQKPVSKEEKTEQEEKPNPNIKPPEFKQIAEGVITSKDKNNLSNLLKKILEEE